MDSGQTLSPNTISIHTDRNFHSKSFDEYSSEYAHMWVDDAQMSIQIHQATSSLAALLQSWLFFGLLLSFLGCTIDTEELVSNGYVDLNRPAMHQHFARWQKKLCALPEVERQLAHREHNTLLKRASIQSDLFEDAAGSLEVNNEDFDLVSLSTKLLINTLSVMVDESFKFIYSTSSRPWVRRISKLSTWMSHWYHFNWLTWLYVSFSPSKRNGKRLINSYLQSNDHETYLQ